VFSPQTNETAFEEVAYNRGLQAYAVHRVLAFKLRDQLLEVAGLEAP